MIMAASPPITAQSGLLIQCGWCNAVKVDGVYRRCPGIPLMNSATDNVSHGICGECMSALRAAMGRMLG